MNITMELEGNHSVLKLVQGPERRYNPEVELMANSMCIGFSCQCEDPQRRSLLHVFWQLQCQRGSLQNGFVMNHAGNVTAIKHAKANGAEGPSLIKNYMCKHIGESPRSY